MTVRVEKPSINLRSKLAELDKPTGIAGEAMLRAETPQEQFQLIGAGRRNLIINGDMRIAQRGTSVASLSSTATYSTCDRWQVQYGSSGTFTESQSNTSPEGFSDSLKLDCTIADASPNYLLIVHRLEGQNLQHLQKGTSAAKSTTLSFYVRSNKTGTYQVNLRDGDNSRIIGVTYDINSADTWEQKKITFAGDTTGTLDNDNGNSLQIEWWLAAGSTYGSGAVPTAWEAEANADRGAGLNVAIGASADDEFYLAGVQLELGKVATPFEHRSYGEELALCQRYYQVLIDAAAGQRPVAAARANSTSTLEFHLPLTVGMRDITSLPQSNMGTVYIYTDSARVNTTSATIVLNDDYRVGSSYAYLRITGASVADDRAYTIAGYEASAFLAVDGEL